MLRVRGEADPGPERSCTTRGRGGRCGPPASRTRTSWQIAEVVGYYAYVNRIADGLGVQLEDDAETAD